MEIPKENRLIESWEESIRIITPVITLELILCSLERKLKIIPKNGRKTTNNPISNALALVDFETRESKKEEIAKFLENLVISLHDLFFVVQESMTERRKRNLDRANKVKNGVNFILGDLIYVRNDVANKYETQKYRMLIMSGQKISP